MRLGPLTLCPVVENTWCSKKTDDTQGPTHSRLAECGNRQAFQARPYHPQSSLSFQRSSVEMEQVALI